MSYQLLIEEGGQPLHGRYQLSPNTFVAQQALLLALLAHEPVVLSGVINLNANGSIVELIHFLGGKTEWKDNDRIIIQPEELSTLAVPRRMLKNESLTFLMLCVLLARYKEGAVETNRKFTSVEELSLYVKRQSGFLVGELGEIKLLEQAQYSTKTLYPAELLGLIVISCLQDGKRTAIQYTELNAELRSLIDLLIQMGADITFADSNILEIVGVTQLEGATYAVPLNQNEVPVISVVTALTNGEVEIVGVKKDTLVPFLAKLDQAEVNYQVEESALRVWGNNNRDFKAFKAQTGLYPGLANEWSGPLAVLMSQSDGESQLVEASDPYGIQFIEYLKMSGVELLTFQPEGDQLTKLGLGQDLKTKTFREKQPAGLKVFGPTKIKGTVYGENEPVESTVPLVLGLVSSDFSEIKQYEYLEDLYPEMVDKLNKLGAKIKEVEI